MLAAAVIALVACVPEPAPAPVPRPTPAPAAATGPGPSLGGGPRLGGCTLDPWTDTCALEEVSAEDLGATSEIIGRYTGPDGPLRAVWVVPTSDAAAATAAVRAIGGLPCEGTRVITGACPGRAATLRAPEVLGVAPRR